MTKKQLYEYGSLYYPYSLDPNWIEWFVRVAELKVQRSLTVLTQYKNSDAKVLDFGCGIGFNTYYYAKVFPNIIGIDNDKLSIDIAKKQLKKLNCNKKILHYDGKLLPFKNNDFDIVNISDVWEHAENPHLMLKEIHRVIKPDGIMYITNPNKLWPIETHYKLPFLSYLPKSIANAYVKFSGKADNYNDINLPTYGEFKKSVEEFFNVKDITFDFVINYKKYSLDKERGLIIPIMGNFLKFIKLFENIPVLSIIYSMCMGFLKRISIGWVFLGWPKKIS
ncbi:hypothetical protein LBMAG33_1420 [Candidatus Levyibacteriota bacterium]|nr:hypothetical protein LBMAG33_1420 [Candidatus Levybacteria bacterium]